MQADAYVEAVLAKCISLQQSNFWPPEPILRPRAWLNNFPQQHRLAAAALLDHFVYYSDRLTDRLLLAALAPVAQQFTDRDTTITASQLRLEAFLAGCVFAPVEGEHPNPADSGHLVCRKIRGLLELPDTSIVTPAQALVRAEAGAPVILVDDFLGSGEQILAHWSRTYPTPHGPSSFSMLSTTKQVDVNYVCLVATSTGLDRVKKSGIPLRVFVAHEVGAAYDVRNLDDKNLLTWFPEIKRQIEGLLFSSSGHLQLPTYMQDKDYPEYGFHSLGLMLGFEHSPCPDATLPIYWARSTNKNHVPLVVRFQ